MTLVTTAGNGTSHAGLQPQGCQRTVFWNVMGAGGRGGVTL